MITACAAGLCVLLGNPPQPTDRALQPPGAELPELVVSHDDTVIDRSCRVVIPAGTVIEDANGDGVIHIAAPGIVVEFADGSVLRGSGAGVLPDGMHGTGIRVEGKTGVTLRGVRLEGFKVGVRATGADGLVLEGCRAEGMFRQHLKSTPAAEDGADWLWPHTNDGQEWVSNYGAAFCVERGKGVTVRDCRVRGAQNGLILDRVEGSKVYDNDFSFLSGWGIAMWRSSGNTISRNALDFCIRGYSHGVYNRGQDSAGLLMFEQCSENVVGENSITHGGDGVFGFAGKEALGEATGPAGFEYKGAGCNHNFFVGNDLSYAAAHGLEMTFSFRNQVTGNRFVENAICGIWGGYSQAMGVRNNTFERNGQMGYGAERGGINIEHGFGNTIENNRFSENACGIYLWASAPGDLSKRPWFEANHKGSAGNLIVGNWFKADKVGIQLRNTTDTVITASTFDAVPKEIDADEKSPPRVSASGTPGFFSEEPGALIGETRPVAARDALNGRASIITTEWGPWDHESVLVRKVRSGAGVDEYEVLGAKGVSAENSQPSGGVRVVMTGRAPGGSWPLRVEAGPGVHAYAVPIVIDGEKHEVRGTIVSARWRVTAFAWDEGTDPRRNLDGWRALATSDKAIHGEADAVEFRYGHGGPRDMAWGKGLGEKAPGPDHFGTIAETTLVLPKGKWRFTTTSDDGVRVRVGPSEDKLATVIENWTWHGPTRDSAVYEQREDGEVRIVVEHFEIDGFAVLEMGIEPGE